MTSRSEPLAAFVSQGNPAICSGHDVEWVAQAIKVTNLESANRFIKRSSYRSGWM